MDTSHILLIFSCCICIIHGQVNVAVDQPNSQLSDLNWAGFLWTSEKSVDGVTDRDQPDTQMSCSSSQDVPGAATANFWRVDMTSPASVGSIVIYGRGDASGSDQLSGFTVDVTSTPGGQETRVHDNAGVEYGTGMFTVEMSGQQVSSVIVRRPSILTLCEVQVFSVTSGASSTVSMGSTQATASSGTTTQGGVTSQVMTTQGGVTSQVMTTQGGVTSPGMTTQGGTTSSGMTTHGGTGASSPGVTTQATTGNGCGRSTGHLHVFLAVYALWKIISCMWRTT